MNFIDVFFNKPCITTLLVIISFIVGEVTGVGDSWLYFFQLFIVIGSYPLESKTFFMISKKKGGCKCNFPYIINLLLGICLVIWIFKGVNVATYVTILQLFWLNAIYIVCRRTYKKYSI